MFSQGLVTIMKGGKVVMKLVVSEDGERAANLAKVIKASREIPTLTEAYDLALVLGFGSQDSLVVIQSHRIKFLGDGWPPNRFLETFDQPEFNPHSVDGTSDFMEVVEL